MPSSRRHALVAGLTATVLAGPGVVAVEAATAATAHRAPRSHPITQVSAGHRAAPTRTTRLEPGVVVHERRDGSDRHIVGHHLLTTRPAAAAARTTRLVRVVVVRERRDGSDRHIVGHRLLGATSVSRGTSR